VNGVPRHVRDVGTRRYEGSRERSWCEPESPSNDSADQDNLGSEPSLARVPEDAITDLVGRDVEEAL